jgi:O-methyltransferase involved in polyketide biosynthesis
MEPGSAPSGVDTSKAHPARMYDYFLGGNDSYPADREAAEAMLRVAPDTRASAQGNRAFLQRVVRFLVGEAGIRQVIDIGAGLPAAGNVHEVAQRIAPDVRVAYVDNDPVVHAHASAMLAGDGNARAVLADLRDPETILTDPGLRELIDFTEPVAVLLIAILHFFPDADDPGRILATLRDALPPGSYLAVSHGTADFHDQARVRRASEVYAKAAAPVALRSHQQVSGFFEGFDLVEPGVVQVPLWRPDHEPLPPGELAKVAIYGGVGRVR